MCVSYSLRVGIELRILPMLGEHPTDILRPPYSSSATKDTEIGGRQTCLITHVLGVWVKLLYQ